MAEKLSLEPDQSIHNYDNDEIQNTTRILLNIKNSFLKDMNIDVDKANSSYSNVQRYDTYDLTLYNSRKISKRTILYANRIRVYIELYYALLDRSVTNVNVDEVHEGIEGVYNPLKIIRNRKFRKNFENYWPNTMLRENKSIIAITAFSSRRIPFPWFVDISERAGDISSRTAHCHELRRPDSTRYFPHRDLNNLKMKYNSGKCSSTSKELSTENHDGLCSNKNLLARSIELPKSSTDSTERTSSISYNKIRRTLSRLAKAPSKSKKGEARGVRVTVKPLCLLENEISVDKSEVSNNNNNMFHDIKTTRLDVEKSMNIKENDRNISMKPTYDEMEVNSSLFLYKRRLAYLNCSWFLMQRKLLTIKAREQKLLKTCNSSREECIQLYKLVSETEQCLDQYNSKLIDVELICRNWKNGIIREYSLRIDNFISTSDQILSELNTKMTLNIKMLQKGLGRLGLLRISHQKVLSKLAYMLLEYLIVVFLWIVWLVFTSAKIIKAVTMLVFRGFQFSFHLIASNN